MIEVHSLRPFLNSDPPYLAEIWSSQPRQRGLSQPMSASVLEQSVFSKPMFDPQGFIVATCENRPVGFAHAGFGPTDDGSGLSTDLGVICMLMVRRDAAAGRDAADGDPTADLASELLSRSEAYLRGRGARVLYAGGIRPLNPFYQGLYGGSELPGVLQSDERTQAIYRDGGYLEIDRVTVLQCDLARFHPRISRRQLRIRRELNFTTTYDPPVTSWWEASTVGDFDRIRFDLVSQADNVTRATATFWYIEPLGTCWGSITAGLIELDVHIERRRSGLATYLLGEAFRVLHSQGVSRIEAQTMHNNDPALRLYESLGFQQVDQGVVLRKNTP